MTVVIWYILDKKGIFLRIGTKGRYVLALIGAIFTLIDIPETYIGLRLGAEGNLVFLFLIDNLPVGWGWGVFILTHLVLILIVLHLGFNARFKENMLSWQLLGSYAIYSGIVAIMNVVILPQWLGVLLNSESYSCLLMLMFNGGLS